MGLFSFLKNVWPIRLAIEKKTAEMVLDATTFKDDESKVIPVWRWRNFKTVKHLVHYKNGKYVVKSLE
jgi:hypothetical protein